MSTDDPRGPSRPGDDGDILRLMRAGDRQGAVDALFQRHGARLRGYCVRMLNGHVLAEDVWQQTFLQAYRDAHTFNGQGSVRAWLYGIARHRCLDAIRVIRAEQQRCAPVAPKAGDDDRDDEGPGPAAPRTVENDPHERLWRVEVKRILLACIARLAPRARDAVIQHYYLGLSFVEMAAASGELAKTLSRRVERCMKFLRSCVIVQGVIHP